MPTRVAHRSLRVVPVVVLLTAAACGSSGSSSSASSSVPLSQCPFSGTTASTSSNGGASTGTLTKVQTSKSGCIDNISFQFSSPPPSWTVSYANGPFVDSSTGAPVSVPGPMTLVLSFAGTSYSAAKPPTTVAPNGLDYVKGINVVAGPNGSLEWIISLDAKAQYTTSESNVPPNVTLAIG
jgi:hypothetical protein